MFIVQNDKPLPSTKGILGELTRAGVQPKQILGIKKNIPRKKIELTLRKTDEVAITTHITIELGWGVVATTQNRILTLLAELKADELEFSMRANAPTNAPHSHRPAHIAIANQLKEAIKALDTANYQY